MQTVGILALAERRLGLGRIGHHLLEPVGKGPGDMLHRAGFGEEHRLEEGDRDAQDAAARLGDAVRHGLLTAHQCHLTKRIPGVEPSEDLALASVARDGNCQVAFEQNAKEVGLVAELNDGFLRFVGSDA